MTTDVKNAQSGTETTHYVRTNVVIDARLMDKALSFSDTKTRRAVIDDALRLYVQKNAQLELLKLRGKVTWEGDLDDLRRNRFAGKDEWDLDGTERIG